MRIRPLVESLACFGILVCATYVLGVSNSIFLREISKNEMEKTVGVVGQSSKLSINVVVPSCTNKGQYTANIISCNYTGTNDVCEQKFNAQGQWDCCTSTTAKWDACVARITASPGGPVGEDEIGTIHSDRVCPARSYDECFCGEQSHECISVRRTSGGCGYYYKGTPGC